jgi:hypothetical protein
LRVCSIPRDLISTGSTGSGAERGNGGNSRYGHCAATLSQRKQGPPKWPCAQQPKSLGESCDIRYGRAVGDRLLPGIAARQHSGRMAGEAFELLEHRHRLFRQRRQVRRGTLTTLPPDDNGRRWGETPRN